MKKALLTLLVLCAAAAATTAGATTPPNSPQSSAFSTAAASSTQITETPLPTALIHVVAWIIAPGIQRLLGITVLPSDVTRIHSVLYRHTDRACVCTLGNPHRISELPARPDARPRPHTESSERAVPSLPDG